MVSGEMVEQCDLCSSYESYRRLSGDCSSDQVDIMLLVQSPYCVDVNPNMVQVFDKTEHIVSYLFFTFGLLRKF